MKFKGFWYDGLLISLAAAVSAVFIVMTVFVEPRLAIAEGVAFLIVCVIAVYRALSAKNRYKRFIAKTSKKLDFTNHKVLSSYPFPVAVCDENGYITWYSNRFLDEIALGEITASDKVSRYLGGIKPDGIGENEDVGVHLNGKYYTVYP
jgi:c-di-AMP phosphodiesterase-like protein